MKKEFHPKAREYLEELPEDVRKKIDDTLGFLERYGIIRLFKAGEIEKLKPFDILELKVRRLRLRYRLLGVVIWSTFWILHIFIKKKRKTPLKEIKTALRRKKTLVTLIRPRDTVIN